MKRARVLKRRIHEVTGQRPCSDDWEFCRQMRRASLSVINFGTQHPALSTSSAL